MLQLSGFILFLILFLYLATGVLYLFVVSVAGRLRRKNVYQPVPEKKSVAVIIPSYKEDAIILDTARKAASHNYPPDKFKVFVIADKLKTETIIRLRAIPVYVIQVEFATSTKAKSLNAALNKIKSEDFELAMILDADNIMAPGCIESVNAAFQKGSMAVQCHRTAKNLQTPVAILDAISEEINNHLFRKGQRALGLSATPIGSGMAFRFTELQSIFNLPHILANPGEDREVDIQLMLNGTTIEYADEANVYDEKVSSSAVFEKQRVRWLEAQLNHFRRFFQQDIKRASKNINFWNKFFQTILLPRSLYILSFIFFLLLIIAESVFDLHFLFPSATWWILLMSLFVFALLLSVPSSFYNIKTARAILHLPVLIGKMVKALFRMKSNRTEFLHTPKTYTQ
jgi:cellulose synthase/poly-beta-1,6-N-acetylglucosamine synthase-like glycosyltransferase